MIGTAIICLYLVKVIVTSQLKRVFRLQKNEDRLKFTAMFKDLPDLCRTMIAQHLNNFEVQKGHLLIKEVGL